MRKLEKHRLLGMTRSGRVKVRQIIRFLGCLRDTMERGISKVEVLARPPVNVKVNRINLVRRGATRPTGQREAVRGGKNLIN